MNKEKSTMRKFTAIVLACALIVTLASCASIKGDASSKESYVEKTLSIKSSTGDYDIAAVLTMPNTASRVPLVAMLHGFAGDKSESKGFVYIAQKLAENGIASIRMDFAGSGDDKRDFLEYTIESAARDAEDCVAYVLSTENIDESKLGLFGYSNGGKIATLINGRDLSYSARVLLAPAASHDASAEKANLEKCGDAGYVSIEWYGRTLKVSKEYYEGVVEYSKDLDEYEKVEIPTLVIHGTNDTTVPSAVVDPFVSVTGADLLKVYGADHGYGFYSDNAEGYSIMERVGTAAVAFFSKEFND